MIAIPDLFVGEGDPSSCENCPVLIIGDPYFVAEFQSADSGILDFLKSCRVAAKSAADV